MFAKKQIFSTYRALLHPRVGETLVRADRTRRFHAPVITVMVVLLALVSGGVFGIAALRHVNLLVHAQVVRTTSPRLTPVSTLTPMHALTPAAQLTQTTASAPAPVSSTPAQVASSSQPTPCSNNQDPQLVLVSISQQHMWACSGSQLAYDTSVTTGAYEISGDATPTGTWHIFDKETNLYLTGPGYKDFVQYWMPFYSDYGFHDASWQTFPFGGSEYSTQGSHGCVHLPTSAASWLYNWAPIGTTVTIEA